MVEVSDWLQGYQGSNLQRPRMTVWEKRNVKCVVRRLTKGERNEDSVTPAKGLMTKSDGRGWSYEMSDSHLDAYHRSYLLTTTQVQKGKQQVELGTLKQRAPHRAWSIDPRWIPRLRAAGLLPLSRMVEATHDHKKIRDRWRPETHTFHLPVGEMTITLEDVSYLLGLPCSGAPVVPKDIGSAWHTEILDRFGAAHLALLGDYQYKPFISSPNRLCYVPRTVHYVMGALRSRMVPVLATVPLPLWVDVLYYCNYGHMSGLRLDAQSLT
uniref:Aminotransferase-like plant mobile domain-containing protein n=1 Tax=Oryza brachyantha TaxID=4533 RepID=J3LRU5_ORYBR